MLNDRAERTLKIKYLRMTRMIMENIYGFSERKFALQIDRKRLIRLLDICAMCLVLSKSNFIRTRSKLKD